ncbi:MAG: Uncharacterised protein [Bacteroidia bacterium]|nr:MAG: Uncharacterised protein [Bacteroidia bacterium]
MISLIFRIHITTSTKILKNLTLLVIIFLSFNSSAQENEVEIRVQDTLYFDQCNTDSYQFIDYYKKTRFETEDTINLNDLYNWDFYNTFFNTGDFDVSRLPCSMKGRYGIIRHIMTITDDKGENHTVVIAMIENNSSAAYITEEAFLNDELLYAPKQ